MLINDGTKQVSAKAFTLITDVTHSLRTVTVRDSFIGSIISGAKTIISPTSPSGTKVFKAGHVCLLPAGSQWDVTNSTAPHGRYSARVITLSKELICAFAEKYPAQGCPPHLQSSVDIVEDVVFAEVFERAYKAISTESVSEVVKQHRLFELLLTLAEKGVVFAPINSILWTDQVCRIVSQRPHAHWTVDSFSKLFNISGSTFRKKLASEGQTVTNCVRETRMEVGVGLLQTTNLAVSEIAERCGYESHSRFSAASKDRFGFVPSKLRK